MNKDDFCKGGIGTGEAGGEAQRWGRREAARAGTSESCILQQALTHWEDDRSAVPFLLRLRNSQSTQRNSASSRVGKWGVEGREPETVEHWGERQGWALEHGLQVVLLLRLPAAAGGENSPCMGWMWNRGSAPPSRLATGGFNTHLCSLCCRVKAQVLSALLLPVRHRNSLEPDWECASWDRCHLAEMSLGRVVTLLPCGQLGTINGDAVLMFVISCPAPYAWQMRRAITESVLSAAF